MKAQCVYENLEFERCKDIRKTLSDWPSWIKNFDNVFFTLRLDGERAQYKKKLEDLLLSLSWKEIPYRSHYQKAFMGIRGARSFQLDHRVIVNTDECLKFAEAVIFIKDRKFDLGSTDSTSTWREALKALMDKIRPQVKTKRYCRDDWDMWKDKYPNRYDYPKANTNENINFERGQDPKKSMEIGLPKRIAQGMESLSKDPLVRQMIHVYQINPTDKGGRYSNFPDDANLYMEISAQEIPTKELMEEILDEHIGMEYFSDVWEDNQIFHTWRPMIKPEYDKIFGQAAALVNITESLDFERGQVPTKAMGAGNEAHRLASRIGISPQDLKHLWNYIGTLEPDDDQTALPSREKEDFDYHVYSLYDDPISWDIEKDSDFYRAIKWAYHHPNQAFSVFNLPPEDVQKIQENLDFERGKDTKDAVNIGAKRVFPRITGEDHFEYGQRASLTDKQIDRVLSNPTNPKYLEADYGFSVIYPDSDVYQYMFLQDLVKAGGDFMYQGKLYNFDNLISESISFEKNDNPNKSLGIGKYRPHEFTFKDYEGDSHTIKVQDNCFKFYDMNICLKFKEYEDDGVLSGEKYATVYVDGKKSDMNVFLMSPAEYEFFVPKKPIIEINGEYKSDPNPENWSKTESAYGYPLVNKEDKEKLKEMQEKYGYWHVSHMDYSRQNKNPFAAVAEMVSFTY